MPPGQAASLKGLELPTDSSHFDASFCRMGVKALITYVTLQRLMVKDAFVFITWYKPSCKSNTLCQGDASCAARRCLHFKVIFECEVGC